MAEAASAPDLQTRNIVLQRVGDTSLFIAGSKDAVITGLIGAKRVNELARVLPNLTRKLIIEGAGHWVQQERPDEVNAALLAFLRNASSG